jgi:nucleotide-binding universal stress UspA family protein
MNGSILLASDGRNGALGAVRFTAALQAEHGVTVEVLAVAPEVPRYGIEALAPYPEGYALYDTVQGEALRQAVQNQLRDAGVDADWPVTVTTGSRATRIARHARERGAAMIVLGGGDHPPLDRWLGDETALRVTRLSTVPVVSVPRSYSGGVRRVLAAIDFSDHSLRAARAALDLVPDDARLILAHVMWPGDEVDAFPSLAEWRKTYARGAEARLREIGNELGGDRSLRVETIVAEGNVADELLSLARRFHVDLIAAGSHGYGFVGRLVMGSASTRILRGAFCPVLIVPPTAPPRDLEAPASSDRARVDALTAHSA